MEVWKIIFLSKWVICRFHVNLPECKLLFPGDERWGKLVIWGNPSSVQIAIVEKPLKI